jgi:outer membrane receptor protein involved in Fe transport
MSPAAGTTEPFLLVDAEVVGDLIATWALANDRFSVTGYVRNIDDNQYKATAFAQTPTTVLCTPYDPRTYGAVLNAHF